MVNSSQIKEALQAHEATPPKDTARQAAEQSKRIHLLREKINDSRYLENALEKLASDLARALY
jgi:sensor c-di-GMP phosphodiesterase-like protein